jgi:hypothetical protein
LLKSPTGVFIVGLGGKISLVTAMIAVYDEAVSPERSGREQLSEAQPRDC